jgi:hypothetical protein
MRKLQFLVIGFAVAVPALLVLAQVNPVERFERGLRPHVAQQGIAGGSLGALPPKRDFYLNGHPYSAIIRADVLDSSPDWDPSQAPPLIYSRLQEIARRELSKMVRDDTDWSVTGFHLESVPRASSLKWFFQVEMKPFWNTSPPEIQTRSDSFGVCIDMSGKPGFIAQRGF